MLVPGLSGQWDNFVFWYVLVKGILKVKRLWHVEHGDDAASSTSNKIEVDVLETGVENNTYEELARDVAWSWIFQDLGEIPFSCVIPRQDNPLKMWELLHQRFRASLSIKKVMTHSSLGPKPCTEQAMQGYFAKRELINAQLA